MPDLFAGPYGDGALGYVIGTPDTAAFARALTGVQESFQCSIELGDNRIITECRGAISFWNTTILRMTPTMYTVYGGTLTTTSALTC